MKMKYIILRLILLVPGIISFLIASYLFLEAMDERRFIGLSIMDMSMNIFIISAILLSGAIIVEALVMILKRIEASDKPVTE